MGKRKRRKKTIQEVMKREAERNVNHFGIVGLFLPASPYPVCRVCGKNYYQHETYKDIEGCNRKYRADRSN